MSSEESSAAAKKSPGRIGAVLRWFVIVLLVLILIPVAAFGAGYATTTVPRPEELAANQVARVLYSDGETVLTDIVPPEGNREVVPIDTVPVAVRDAVLAAEDREFYTNPGFSVTGFARAAIGQITGNTSAGGGSTITQQYVKNVLVGDERSYIRKAKELVISAKMTREWSKDEILAAYLNTIYFGRTAYGISAASQAYFNKPVSELTAAEGAVLAASIQRPSQLDPATNREEAEARWNYVLDGMVETGALSEFERAARVYPEVIPLDQVTVFDTASGPDSHIRTHVLQELTGLGIAEQDINTLGLKITTTIDQQVQQASLDAVAQIMDGEEDNLITANATIDPTTGAVRGYYGGEEPGGFDYANAGLQTGSSFKVFGYAAALEQGISPNQMYDSSPITVGDAQITNVSGQSCGFCAIKEALRQSLNTSFMRLQEDLENGPSDTAEMAHRLGVAEELPGIGQTLVEPGVGEPYAGVILGQYQTRVLDMASAYATLAAEGVYREPYFVERVEDADGRVLYEHTANAGEQVLEANVANNVTDGMLPIAAYSNGNTLAGGRPSASKTGTAQFGDTGLNKDAWMVGYTPQLSTAVWVGSHDNTPILTPYGGSIYGSGIPAQMWKYILDNGLSGQPVEYFTAAQPLATRGVTMPPGYVAPTSAAPTSETEEPEPEETTVSEPAPADPLGQLLNDLFGTAQQETQSPAPTEGDPVATEVPAN